MEDGCRLYWKWRSGTRMEDGRRLWSEDLLIVDRHIL
jgi:hypothetical protein